MADRRCCGMRVRPTLFALRDRTLMISSRTGALLLFNLCMLVLIWYEFSLFAFLFFDGWLTRAVNRYGADGVPVNIELTGFSDFSTSFISMFQIIILNNW